MKQRPVYVPRQDPAWYVSIGAILCAGIVALALVVGAAQLASAQEGICGFKTAKTPIAAQVTSGAAFETLSVDAATAVSLTIPTCSPGCPVIGAFVEIQNGLVSVRMDGTAPTAATNGGGSVYGPGTTLITGSPTVLEVCSNDLRNLQMIRSSASATDSRVNVRYYVP